ncbi:MAG: OmpA family protein [Bacteroidota bacterium]|nr:OmpA family protein [Bacteroidota bacterium]
MKLSTLMSGYKLPILCLVVVCLSLAACVPQRKYDDLFKNYQTALKQNSDCDTRLSSLQMDYDSVQAYVKGMNQTIVELKDDTTEVGKAYRKTRVLYDKINDQYERLLGQAKEQEGNNRLEKQEISAQLQETRRKLEEKEKELKKQEALLLEKEKILANLDVKLKEREKRVGELQMVLTQKDSANNALKTKLNKALFAYKDKGLTIEVRNGRVYVSVEDKLLFQSGKYTLNQDGKDALVKLSGALKDNSDVSITVEGHTDNVPYRGKGDIKDNLDLSVHRATEVTKILTTNGLMPKNVIASGRGETQPIGDNGTESGRAKNRRTEIILTPKLSDLYEILK